MSPARSTRPLWRLLIPTTVRRRVMLATALLTLPLFLLLLVMDEHAYQLARRLESDGESAALGGTQEMILLTALSALLWIGTCVILCVMAAERRVLRPLRHLTRAASRLADGELETRVDMTLIRMADMRALGATLNLMARMLGTLALTDSLTSVANRRQFDQVVLGEVKRASRLKKGLALLLVDVDKFKAYNDTNGHHAGDLCLKQIALALSETVRRPSDLVARYGGEEFAVLLPDTDEEGAMTVAEEMLAMVRSLGIPHSAWEKGIVTISIGIAVRYPPAIDAVTLIQEADQALYAAKDAGRDRALLRQAAVREA